MRVRSVLVVGRGEVRRDFHDVCVSIDEKREHVASCEFQAAHRLIEQIVVPVCHRDGDGAASPLSGE